VHNVDAHNFKAAQLRRQEEAVKCIQAAYRGHQVRKSLQWNLHSSGSHHKAKQPKHATPRHATTATTSKQKSTVTGVKSKKSAKKMLLPQQGKSATVKKVTTPVKDKVTHKAMLEVDKDTHKAMLEVDNSSSYDSGPATTLLPWEQTGGDNMSVINIYTRRYEKLQEQLSATTG